MWGKTVTIELNHSDIDLSELLEIFKGLTIASGFEMSSWNSVIKDLSADIHDYEREDLKEKLNEWKAEDDEDEYKDLRHSSLKDSEGYENLDELENDFFGPIEEERNIDAEREMEREAERRMDIIGQNGNEGTHYQYDWDNSNSYEGESNTILNSINDSITLIKNRMVDIDLKMDNIDEQLGILNADVANIEFNIQHPLKRSLLNAKEVYDKSLIETKRFNKVRKDIVDMESGEVSYDEDGGFAVKMNKDVGKIKDIKK